MKNLFILALLCCAYLSADIEKPEHRRSIGVIIFENWRGELEFAEKIKIACDTLDWTAMVYTPKTFVELKNVHDWILTMVPTRNNCKVSDNYLVLFEPDNHFFQKNGHLKKTYLGFSGYLPTYEATDLLLSDMGGDIRKIYPQPWYPLAQYREYRQVSPDALFVIIGHWGDRLMNERYQTLQNKLSLTDYARMYGNPKIGNQYGDAFLGDIPFDGKSVIDKISESGVCLVLHSEVHLKHGLPSDRIFEAAASSSVIISDLNPFVIEHFGDAVLYVDQELSGEEMFNQIDGHMEWIRSHPEEALSMAQKSYQIFEEKFVLENQLMQFDAFRESVKSIEGN